MRSISVLCSFHPGWLDAVMGTAIVGRHASMHPGNVAAFALAAIAFVAERWFKLDVVWVFAGVTH